MANFRNEAGMGYKYNDTRRGTVASAKQRCACCAKRVEADFKGSPRLTDTWYWLECTTCRRPVCEDCSDEETSSWPDNDYSCVCLDCLRVSRGMTVSL